MLALIEAFSIVRATPSKLPKRASCGLYKNSGSNEMRLMGDRDRIRSGTVGAVELR